MADKNKSRDKDEEGKFSGGAIFGISLLIAIAGVILWWVLIPHEKQASSETRLTVTTSTAEMPKFISFDVTGKDFVLCPDRKDVQLVPDDKGIIGIPLRPCKDGIFSLPKNWNGFDFDSTTKEDIHFWTLEGKHRLATAKEATAIKPVGRHFWVASPGGGILYLYPKGQKVAPEDEGINIRTVQGTVVQHSPEHELLILKTKEGEEKFHVTPKTPLQIGFKTYYLGRQGLFSAKESAFLEKGDVVEVRFDPKSRTAVGVDLLMDVREEKNLIATNGTSKPELVVAREGNTPREEKIVYGVIEVVDVESQLLIVQAAENKTLSVRVWEYTPIVLNGETCTFESLRPGDPVAIFFLENSDVVRGIEVDPPLPGSRRRHGNDLWVSYFPKFAPDKPTEDTWSRYFP